MLNSSEKLEKFKSTVFAEVEEKAKEMLEETRAECEERIARAEAQAEELVRSGKAEAEETARLKLVREGSAGSLVARKRLLQEREHMIGRVFDSVYKKLGEFTRSDAYPELMQKRLVECAEVRPGEKGIVRIRPADRVLAAKLTMNGRFTVEESDSIVFGGLTVIFPEENLALDCTFDSVLEEQRRAFAQKLG